MALEFYYRYITIPKSHDISKWEILKIYNSNFTGKNNIFLMRLPQTVEALRVFVLLCTTSIMIGQKSSNSEGKKVGLKL